MAPEVDRLAGEMAALVDVAERARVVLRRYARLSDQVVQRVQGGQLLVDALDELEGPLRRREVTAVMEELSAARHRVRLAMFALGASQGTSPTDLGRKLGLSRQLASRLANEATRTSP